MSETPYSYRCDYDNCPTHERVDVDGSQMLTVIFRRKILYFYATDCLALWAGSFPIGFVPVGKEPKGERNDD